ncbi:MULTISPECIES: glutaminyl-peptide cyclotransferase [unclassified Corynebacterium]|uniref:glutaminyl-peptide cyclotransferase n=1 Tax=unclassified Corynebacterium TaxID=2624378 RepID=UPI0034CDAE4A
MGSLLSPLRHRQRPRKHQQTRRLGALLACAGLALSACSATPDTDRGADHAASAPEDGAATTAAPAVERLQARVVERLDYDESLFTQGLEVDEDGNLLVGTGRYGESGMHRLVPGETSPQQSTALADDQFGEGITRSGDTLWQLTWKSGTALSFDADTLEPTGSAEYSGEGWGLCDMGDRLALSDGSSTLRFMDRDNFDELDRVTVTLDGEEIDEINELECVDGKIYANVWFSTDILRIDPATGTVDAVIDASGLANNAAPNPDNVLNGIAHIPGTDEFYLTGKRWPDLYRVTFE